MNAKRFLVLKTDVEVQLVAIDEVCAKLEDRAQGFRSDDARPIQVDSVAYRIHNSYSAIKALLRVLASHFEYKISDSVNWKAALLPRMTQPYPGVRPAPLTKETFALLDTLRDFRHFFRHANASTIAPVLLESNLQLSRRAHSLLHRDISDFMDPIRQAK